MKTQTRLVLLILIILLSWVHNIFQFSLAPCGCGAMVPSVFLVKLDRRRHFVFVWRKGLGWLLFVSVRKYICFFGFENKYLRLNLCLSQTSLYFSSFPCRNVFGASFASSFDEFISPDWKLIDILLIRTYVNTILSYTVPEEFGWNRMRDCEKSKNPLTRQSASDRHSSVPLADAGDNAFNSIYIK